MSAVLTEPSLCVTRLAGKELPAALEADWNRLAGDIPCRRWDWLEPWWRHYGRNEGELFVLQAHDQNGQLVGLAPWYLRRRLGEGRVVRFLGSGNVCSDYLTIFAAPEQRTAVVNSIADWLNSDRPGWDLIELNGGMASDQALQQLVDALSERDHLIYQRRGESCWQLSLPDSWEEFLRTLSTTRRSRVKKMVREYFDTGLAVAKVVDSVEQLSAGYRLLIELHQKRRRSLDQPGCFADPVFIAYHQEVTERFLQAGRLRLQYLMLEGRPVSVEYDLLGGDAIYHYQSGIEPEALESQPGRMGTVATIQAAIQNKMRTLDFMRGDEAYKSEWGAVAQPTWETRIVAHRTSAHLRHSAWRAKHEMRQWAKSRWHQWRGDE
ncbi:MAG: GNAT family N-acetyltransferase [Planctomycetota bacterium]|nr:GNAT family N-acetyltransferase [Planctomycetota bacterium]